MRHLLQTIQYVLTDYYNYYYGGCYDNPEAADTQESQAKAQVDAADGCEAAEVSTLEEAAAEGVSHQPDSGVAVVAEVCFRK